MTKKTFLWSFFFAVTITGVAAASDDTGDHPDLTKRMMMLITQLGIILLAARLGNILFRTLKLSGVLGEVFSGLIIGPYLLGGIPFSGFPHGIFPEYMQANGTTFPVSPELYGICAIAAIILLFTVGLETDLPLLLKFFGAGSLVGICGVVFSFVFGDLITIAFSKFVFNQELGFFDAPCLFLGVISTATSVGISARILEEKKKLDSPEGVTILSGAVIDDVLGIILLAVVLGIIAAKREAGHIHWGHIGSTAAEAIGIWIGSTILGLLASQKISAVLKLFRDRSIIAFMSLGLALIIAGLFEHLGLAMIIGSYIMGLAFSMTDIANLLEQRLRPLYTFFVPVFFCVMGMLINFSHLTSASILIFGTVYSLIAIATKVLGCGLPVLFYKFNVLGSLRIGFGMLPRCEVALTIAGIGLAKGIIDQEIIGVAILLMAFTTLISPPMLSFLFAQEKRGTWKPVPQKETEIVHFPLPSAEAATLLTNNLLTTFENEGFFTHMIDREDNIYQLRKEDMIIGMRQEHDTIEFTCKASIISLVNSAMCEATAEFERIISGLKKPLDANSIARKVQEPQQAADADKEDLVLADYFKPHMLNPALAADTKEGIIKELIDLLAANKLISNRAEATAAVLERERSMSTGMQFGLAIPHGKTDAVRKLTCAAGIKKEGIDFGAIDGKPSKFFILTLMPKTTTAPYLQFMSAISRAFNKKLRKQLLESETPQDMYQALTGKDNGGR